MFGSLRFALAVLKMRTTAGLTLAATSTIADDSSIVTGVVRLVDWPVGTAATGAGVFEGTARAEQPVGGAGGEDRRQERGREDRPEDPAAASGAAPGPKRPRRPPAPARTTPRASAGRVSPRSRGLDRRARASARRRRSPGGRRRRGRGDGRGGRRGRHDGGRHHDVRGWHDGRVGTGVATGSDVVDEPADRREPTGRSGRRRAPSRPKVRRSARRVRSVARRARWVVRSRRALLGMGA